MNIKNKEKKSRFIRPLFKKSSGFSLIEMLIALSIMIIISTILYANYPNLSGRQSIDRAVRFVSLTIREAEIKAMAIHEDPFSPGQGIFPAYGIYLTAGSNKKVILYSDFNVDCTTSTPKNCNYDGGVNDKIVTERIIPTSAIIKNLCGNIKSGGKICGLTKLSITFLRPAPSIYLQGDAGAGYKEFNDVEILIDTPGGTKRQQKLIGITQSGQIFIESDSVN